MTLPINGGYDEIIAETKNRASVALHEIGQLLGLAHSTIKGSVIRKNISSNFTLSTLQAYNIFGIQSLYGRW